LRPALSADVLRRSDEEWCVTPRGAASRRKRRRGLISVIRRDVRRDAHPETCGGVGVRRTGTGMMRHDAASFSVIRRTGAA